MSTLRIASFNFFGTNTSAGLNTYVRQFISLYVNLYLYIGMVNDHHA